ncbi:MAG: LCP family protein, partial [Vulcanimicrobiota bacterium]
MTDALSGHEKKRMKKMEFDWFRASILAIITIFAACVIYIVGLAYIRDNPGVVTAEFKPRERIMELDRVIREPGGVLFKDKERLLILCLGLDENRDHRGIGYSKGARTDTIFLLSVDKKAEKLGVLSIPRDTWINVENYAGGKINSIYADAFWEEFERSGQNLESARNAGIMRLRKTVSEFLDVEIDYFVLIKIKAAKELVDALGGVNIDVEKDMDYDDNWGKLHVHLKKGPQRLNGEQLVGYARFRHDEEGDWGRIRRQQQAVQAFINELKKPTHIMNIGRISRVFKENLETDLSSMELVDLATVYRNFDKNQVIKGVISGYDDWAGGAMIIVPDEKEIDRIVHRVLKGPDDIFPPDIRIGILNTSSYDDLGEPVGRILHQQGFTVYQLREPDINDLEETEIL